MPASAPNVGTLVTFSGSSLIPYISGFPQNEVNKNIWHIFYNTNLLKRLTSLLFSSVQFSRSVMSDSLRIGPYSYFVCFLITVTF